MTENPRPFEASSALPLRNPDERLQEVLSHLKNPRPSGGAYSAHCPAHPDKKKSLRVGRWRDGGVWIKCNAGCASHAVLAALDLTAEELVANRPSTGARRPQRRYEYRDADGKLVGFKVRWSGRGRGFSWEGPDGSSGLDGLTVGLYHRPEVDAAVRAGNVVWLVEGERDADTLTATGLTATTGPHGAGSWRQEWTAVLAGAAVVLVADRDKYGVDHASVVAAELIAAHCAVTTLVAPAPHKDVTDLLESGGTIDDLEPLTSDIDLGAPKIRRGEDGREIFAMMPNSALALDAYCVKLLFLLDMEQGDSGLPMAGRNKIAKLLGWGNKQASEHLGHLDSAGFIKVERSGGQRRVTYRVLNPSRKRPVKDRSGPPETPPSDPLVVHSDNTCGSPATPQSRSSGLRKVLELERVGEEALLQSFPGVVEVAP